MARTPKNMGTGQLSTSATTMYTAPAATNGIVRRLTLYNTSSSNVSVDIFRVASGGAITDAGAQVTTKTVPAGRPYVVYEIEGHNLATGETIQGTAGTASVIDYNMSGTEVT